MDGLTTKQAAAEITRQHAPTGVIVAEWQVRRIFELGILPEPLKFAGKRVIKRAILPNWLERFGNAGGFLSRSLPDDRACRII